MRAGLSFGKMLGFIKRKTQMAEQIERLARFVAETTLEQVPQEVQRHAKLCRFLPIADSVPVIADSL
jgi:hypothetical protein